MVTTHPQWVSLVFFEIASRQTETQDTHLEFPGELKPSSEWLIKEAYNKVMNDIKASDTFKKRFLDALIEDTKSGGGRRYFNKMVKPHLLHEAWEWPEYDYFYKKFKELNEWPFLWDKYLYKHPPEPKKSVEEALPLFNIKEIKQILNDNNLMPKPMPKLRKDYEKVLIQKVNWELIEQLVIGKYEEEPRYYEIKKKEAKLELLYGYLVLTLNGTINTIVQKRILDKKNIVGILLVRLWLLRPNNNRAIITKENSIKWYNMRACSVNW